MTNSTQNMCPICKTRPANQNHSGFCSRICYDVEFILHRGRLIDDTEFLRVIAEKRHDAELRDKLHFKFEYEQY